MENYKSKNHAGENATEERPRRQVQEVEINIVEFFTILRMVWWKLVLFSLAVGFLILVVMFQLPNIYKATAVITPAIDEKRTNPALGVLASFGIDVGSPSKVEDLENLFKSNDLTVRVFKNNSLWPIVFLEQFDAATGKVKVCWTDRLLRGVKNPRTPGDWDAIRIAEDRLEVSVNKKSGTVSVSYESPFAEGSANIVKYYLEEGKSRLQEEALDRAIKNKKFIEEQIGKTLDALTRDRLYSLYGQEVEREMMARNREQFGFRVIDSPRIPDRKSKPSRVLAALIGTLIAGFAFSIYLVRDRRKQMTAEEEHGKREELS